MSWIFSSPACDEFALLAQARAVLKQRPVSLHCLNTLGADYGIQLATALCYEVLCQQPETQQLLAQLPPAKETRAEGLHVAIIPTLYHRERPEIDGQGGLVAAIATRMGAQVSLLPLASLGSVRSNAHHLAQILPRWKQPHWIVSLSKGSADLKSALCQQPELWRYIAGWISLSGVPGGTPLVESHPGRPLSHRLMGTWLRLRGAEPELLQELSTQHPLSKMQLTVPAHIPVINICGLPLESHLRAPVLRSWRYLAQFGPNDGYVPLGTALLPGVSLPLWGADHYLRVPALQPLFAQLLHWAAHREVYR